MVELSIISGKWEAISFADDQRDLIISSSCRFGSSSNDEISLHIQQKSLQCIKTFHQSTILIIPEKPSLYAFLSRLSAFPWLAGTVLAMRDIRPTDTLL